MPIEKDVVIGIDIDGVLANFVKAYQELFIKLIGKDLFLPGDIEDPPCWDWPQLRGYTKAEVNVVWIAIREDKRFWRNLYTHYENTVALRNAFWNRSAVSSRVYAITSRPGLEVQHQTSCWLQDHCEWFTEPLIVGHRVKGITARALELDAYIDDNADNILDVLQDSPKTRAYLLDRRYNEYAQDSIVEEGGRIVPNLESFLNQELPAKVLS